MWQTAMRILAIGLGLTLLGIASCQRMPTAREKSLAVYPTGIKGTPTIRVQVLSRLERTSLTVTGPYRLDVVHTDDRTETGGSSVPVTVELSGVAEGVRLGQDTVKSATITPLKNAALRIGNSSYRYPLTFSAMTKTTTDGEIPAVRVVASIGIEEYLVGVVGSEMYPSWPAEALRAQAVAARTFAYYRIKTRTKKAFDVTSDVRSQVWKPTPNADPQVVMSVNSTRGVVMTEQNFRLFPAYYHSESGGYTADSQYVFTQRYLRPLSGVRCPYGTSADAPKPWRKSYTRDEIAARLAKAGIIRGELLRLTPMDQNKKPLREMQRVYFIEIVMKDGVRVTIPGEQFRLAIGPGKSELRSTFFTVIPSMEHITFEGRGFGHGVGMPQYGAWYLAGKGYLYEDILATYYPGMKLVRLWGKDIAPPDLHASLGEDR